MPSQIILLSIQAFLGLIALWLLVNAAGAGEQAIQAEAGYQSNSQALVVLSRQS